jgi:multidrug resistance efflux pump
MENTKNRQTYEDISEGVKRDLEELEDIGERLNKAFYDLQDFIIRHRGAGITPNQNMRIQEAVNAFTPILNFYKASILDTLRKV